MEATRPRLAATEASSGHGMEMPMNLEPLTDDSAACSPSKEE